MLHADARPAVPARVLRVLRETVSMALRDMMPERPGRVEEIRRQATAPVAPRGR